MRTGILKTRILIYPKTIRCLIENLVDPLQFSWQKLTGRIIRVFDHLNFSTIGRQDIEVLLSNLGVDKATKTQAMIGTDLRKPNTGIAGTGLYHKCFRIDFARLHGPFNDGNTGTVLGATTRIESLKFCKTVEM